MIDYSLKSIKDKIIRFRHDNKYAGALTVKVPFEAEHSLGFLRSTYGPDLVTFMAEDLPVGALEIYKKDAV